VSGPRTAVDLIDAAIAASDVPPPAYLKITTSRGRDVVVAMPKDLAEIELLDLITFLSSAQMRMIAREGSKTPEERARDAALAKLVLPT
jgi:hypothetical protein